MARKNRAGQIHHQNPQIRSRMASCSAPQRRRSADAISEVLVVPNSLLNVRKSISAIYQRQPFGGGSKDIEVITIKNKSTFHSEAKRRQDDKVLLIYTAGRSGECTKITYAAS